MLVYFFRGNINFMKENRSLRIVSHFWLAQNICLAFTAFLKCIHYINYYSLTYKRIGVLIFLLLTIFGLAMMFFKIEKRKSLFFLLRSNSWFIYLFFVGASMVNWDASIAKYNIADSEIETVDYNYILSLSDKVLPTLIEDKDFHLQNLGIGHYNQAGSFPISQFIAPMFNGMREGLVVIIERAAWWLHIAGILVFLNYLYFSKHLHILLAFPNTFYADLNAKGKLNNLESVTNEVKLMMDPTADPFAAPANPDAVPAKFGASDVQDLNWVQLLNAYSCTECGRCTSSCPANQTGKKLSPRKIMMDTRDRLEEVGRNIDLNKGVFVDDGKSLLNDYITPEELWACTTCNACVEECPINISPLSIIIDMRRYLVMEQSAAPMELNNMMSNIENNGAPWQYNQMDRLNWVNE